MIAFGKVCAEHPQLNGKRRKGDCVQCANERKYAKRKDHDAYSIGKVCAKHPERQGHRYRGQCISCRNEKSNARAKANGHAHQKKWKAHNPQGVKDAALRQKGFTRVSYDSAIQLQAGACAICKQDFTELSPRQIHADHSHATGEARGVLCMPCNNGLGLFRDNPATLEAAARYLRNPTL